MGVPAIKMAHQNKPLS